MYPNSQPAPSNPMPGQYTTGPPAGQYFPGQQQQPFYSQPAFSNPPGQYTAGPPAGQYFPGQQPPPPVFDQPSNFPNNHPNDLNFLLGPLLGADKVIVKQKKEMLEIFSGWETNNRYEIYDGRGQVTFYAFEDTSALSMCCFGENRPFCIRVINFQGQQINYNQNETETNTEIVVLKLVKLKLKLWIRKLL
uniref:Phospholipid scramblase n=1 Tax=Romanomermis culicivorax TaxID=13658 RepID=A0A915KQD1_ROMCU